MTKIITSLVLAASILAGVGAAQAAPSGKSPGAPVVHSDGSNADQGASKLFSDLAQNGN